MKAFQKTIALALLLVASTLTAVAKDAIPTVTIEKSGYEKKISVIIEHLKVPASVQITSTRGSVLEIEASEGERFAKIFNVSNLEDGTYRVVVVMPSNEIVQPFSIKANKLELKPSEREVFFAPTLSWKNQALDVMMFNNRLVDVNVKLFDEYGNTVFEDSMQNVLKVERRYNLNELNRGKYTVQVETPHKAYFKNIVVK